MQIEKWSSQRKTFQIQKLRRGAHFQRNTFSQSTLLYLLTEVYKLLNGYSPDIMNDIFHLRQNTHNLRNFHAFATDVSRNNCMINSVIYGANKVWETFPFDLKNSCSLELFKKGLKNCLKNWRCTRCSCQICSRFIAHVRYI